ncbi:MAG: hypothetical protein LUF04_13380 [Bacteroides sp.]|nr:hypothetical protein [Bacteroides sp.]
MKAKYLFSALCLGALAACSNEEFMEQTASEANLPKVNVTIGAEFGGFAQTRQSYGEDMTDWNYYWTNADIIGACKASGAGGALDGGNLISSNHPFTNDLKEGELAKATSFSTVTAVTTGKYIFYTPYKKNMLGNVTVNPELPEIQLQEGSSRKHLMENNFFITPMLDITNEKGAEFEYGAKIDLPLTFKSIYHTLNMEIGITSSTPSAITVDKIVVTPVDDSDDPIETKNGAPLDFATIAKGSGSGNDNVVTIDADAVADKNALADDVKEKLENLMDVDVDILGGVTAAQSYTLKIKDGYTYSAATDKCAATMLIPAGEYNKLKFEIYTSEGIYTEIVALSSTPASTVKMNRNAVTTLSKSLNIHYNIGDNNVEPVKDFTINSVDDWNYACKFVQDHFNQFGATSSWGTPTFTLNKDIEVETYPTDFGFNLTATAAHTLTVKAESFNLAKTTLSSAYVTIEVAQGSILTFDTEVTNAASNLKLVNYGTIVNNIVPTASNAGLSLKFASLTNGENTEGGKTGTITNNGAMTPTGLTNNQDGIINNAVKAKIAAGASTITNNGEINLLGEDSELELTGAAALENNGTVTIAAKAKATNGGSGAVTGTGNIIIQDVNNFTLAPSLAVTQIVSVEVTSLADFKKAITSSGDLAKINDVTVTAAITTDAAVTAGQKSITLKDDLTLKGDFTVKKIIADGTSTIAANTGTTVSADLIVNAGKTLTVGKNITFNTYNQSNVKKADILGTLTNNGKMYFAKATVGEAKIPVAKNGALNVTTSGAEFAVNDAIVNHGTVTQSGEGKIGPSVTNEGVATFNGNADGNLKVPV